MMNDNITMDVSGNDNDNNNNNLIMISNLDVDNLIQQVKELEGRLVESKQTLSSRNDEVNMLKDEIDRKDNEFREIHNKLREIQYDNSTLKANEFKLELENNKLLREMKLGEDNVVNLEYSLNRKNIEISQISTKLNNKIQDMECEQFISKIEASEKDSKLKAANDQLLLYKEKNDEYLSQLGRLEYEIIYQKTSFLKEIDEVINVKDKYKNQVDEYYDMITNMKESNELRDVTFNNDKRRLLEELQERLDESGRYFQQLLQEKDKEIRASADNYSSNKSSVALIDNDFVDDDINFAGENNSLVSQFKAIRKELAIERLKSRELDSFLKNMEQEREMYKPIVENQNRAYGQMQEAHLFLQQKMHEVISINSNLSIDLRNTQRLLEDENEKVKALNMLKLDLSNQIKHLLGHSHGRGHESRAITTQDVISSSLVTFNDINDLQNKNIQLLNVLRNVVAREGDGNPADIMFVDGTLELGVLSDKHMIIEELLKQRQARQKAENIIEDLKEQIHYYTSMAGLGRQSSPKKLIGDSHHQSPTPSKFSAVKSKLHQAEQEVADLKERIAEYESETNKMKEKAKNLQSDLIKYQTSHAQLTSESRASRGELQRLMQQIKTLDIEVSGYRKKIADSEKTIIDQRQSSEKHQALSQELQEKITVAEKKLHTLQIELSVTKESEANLIEMLRKKVDEMQRQDLLIQSTQRIEVSLSKKWEEEKSRLINDNTIATKTIEQLRNDVVDRKLMHEQHQRAVREEVDACRLKLQEGNHEIIKLREALILERGRSKEAEDHNVMLDGQLKMITSRLRVLEGSMVSDPVTESASMDRELEIGRFKLEIESMKSLISVLEVNLTKSQSISSINETSVANMKQEMLSMKAKHDEEMKRSQGELTIALQKVSASQKKFDNLTAQRNALNEKLAQTCAEYDNKVFSLKGEILQELAKNNESGVNIELLKMEVLRFQKAAKAANTNYENEVELRKQCQIQIKLLESEKARTDAASVEGEQTKNSSTNSISDVSELKNQMENLRKLNDVLLTKTQYMEAQMDRLGGATSGNSMETSNDDMDLVRKSADDSREVIRHMQRERDALMLTISNMENENARLSGLLNSSNKSLDEARSDLKQEIDKPITIRKKEEFELLMLEVMQLNKVRDMNIKLKNEVDDLRQKNDTLLVDLQTASKGLDPLKTQIRELSLQKQLYEKEKESLQKDLQLWSDRHAQLVARYSEVDPIEYQNLKQSADELKENLKRSQQRVQSYNNENGKLKTSLTQKESEYSLLQKELENERSRTLKLSDKMRDWKTKISDQQREKAELTTRNDELNKDITSLQETNLTLTEQSKESLRQIQEKDTQLTLMQKQQVEIEKEREREKEKEKERKNSALEASKKRKDMGPEVIDEGSKDLEKSLKQQLKEKLKSKIMENANEVEDQEQPDIKKLKSSSSLATFKASEQVGPFGSSPFSSKSVLNPTALPFFKQTKANPISKAIPKLNNKEDGEESD